MRSLPLSTVTASSLRRQKSTISKGNTHNMHMFTRSIGKGGPSRSELFDILQQQEAEEHKQGNCSQTIE
jgi:hypothetical protein